MTVQEVIAQIPGWAAAGRVSVVPLEGGITNENYHVEVDGEPFVVRIGGRNAHLLGIDRARECAAAQTAAQLGVGAEVVFAAPAAAVLVTRFVPGRALTAEDVSRPLVLGRVAEAIRTIHAGPAIPGTFSPFRTVEVYREIAVQHGVALPPELDAWSALARRIEAALPGGPLVACHNDLLPSNLMDDGERIRIVDWEYAAMGDPFFDVGNLAANADLGPAEERELLERYCGAASTEALARLGLTRLASDLREAMWGLVQVGISRLAFDFRGYATRHFERFAARAASTQVGEWLER